MKLGPDRSSSESESLFSDVESEDLSQEGKFERNMRHRRLSSSRRRYTKPEYFEADPSYSAENPERPFRRGGPWVSDESDTTNYTTSLENAYSSGTMIADGNGGRYWSAAPFAPGEF